MESLRGLRKSVRSWGPTTLPQLADTLLSCARVILDSSWLHSHVPKRSGTIPRSAAGSLKETSGRPGFVHDNVCRRGIVWQSQHMRRFRNIAKFSEESKDRSRCWCMHTNRVSKDLRH